MPGAALGQVQRMIQISAKPGYAFSTSHLEDTSGPISPVWHYHLSHSYSLGILLIPFTLLLSPASTRSRPIPSSSLPVAASCSWYPSYSTRPSHVPLLAHPSCSPGPLRHGRGRFRMDSLTSLFVLLWTSSFCIWAYRAVSCIYFTCFCALHAHACFHATAHREASFPTLITAWLPFFSNSPNLQTMRWPHRIRTD